MAHRAETALAEPRRRLETFARDLDRARRQRLLPAPEHQERICRYESHISREERALGAV